MNRPIKFRAWDKSKSEMIYSGIEFELRAINYPSKYGENNAWGSDTIGFMNINEEYFDIMQFTGIKDKKEKELYEGDIVITGNGRKWSVEFGRYEYFEESPALGFYLKPIIPIIKGVFPLGYENMNLEIIGNIYENPELVLINK